eukprot:g433.t1
MQVVIITRHAERVDYVERDAGGNWQATAAEPWNTPITANGMLQAEALGRAIARESTRLGLPPVTRVMSSPFLRCLQTGAGALCGLGVGGGDDDAQAAGPKIGVEPLLVETMSEDWMRSWAVPGANAIWGGPAHCRRERNPGMAGGVHVPFDSIDPATLRPQALQDARSDLVCRPAAATLEALTPPGGLYCGVAGAEATRRLLDVGYARLPTPPAVAAAGAASWGKFEDEECVGLRLDAVLEAAAAASSETAGTTLLVCHGGPTAAFVRRALRGAPPPGGWQTMKFCALNVLVRDAPGDAWRAALYADSRHLAEVAGATASGTTDAAESHAAGGAK